MKSRLLGIAALAASAASDATFVQRPTIPPTATVAYVSAQRLTNETTVGKQGVARLQALQQQRQAELLTRQQTLEATRQPLNATTDAVGRAALQQQEHQQETALERATAEGQTEAPKINAAPAPAAAGASAQ